MQEIAILNLERQDPASRKGWHRVNFGDVAEFIVIRNSCKETSSQFKPGIEHLTEVSFPVKINSRANPVLKILNLQFLHIIYFRLKTTIVSVR